MDKSFLKLLGWLLKNQKALNIQVKKRKWTSTMLPNLFDVAVFGKPNGKAHVGQGAGLSYPEAYVKACAEFIERDILISNRLINSNGCALHSTAPQAKLKAKLELIERDAFLCHFLTGTPMERMDIGPIKVFGQPIEKFYQTLKKKNLKISFYRMRAAVDLWALTAVIDGSKDKAKQIDFYMGHGCDFTLEKSAQQSIIEALRTYAWIRQEASGFRKAITAKQFIKKNKFVKKPTIEDHLRLWLCRSYVRQLNSILFSGNPDPSVGSSFLKLGSIPAKIYPNKLGMGKTPFYFAKAESKMLQSLYFGPTKKRHLNEDRLRKFLGFAASKPLKLVKLPHPFA